MKLLTSKRFIVAVALVAVIVVLVIVLGGGDDDKPANTPNTGTVTANELKSGDCISDANSTLGDVTTFDAVACDMPHDGEVFTLIVLPGAEGAKYPGADEVTGKGQRGCRARLRRQATAEAFKDKLLGFKFVYPTPASWADGDREITCLATFRKPRSEKLAQR